MKMKNFKTFMRLKDMIWPANDARNDFQRQKDASNDNRAPLFNFTAIYCVFDTIE